MATCRVVSVSLDRANDAFLKRRELRRATPVPMLKLPTKMVRNCPIANPHDLTETSCPLKETKVLYKTMATASLRTDSPKTSEYIFGSTLRE